MKKSSYAIIGTIIAGAVAVSLLTAILFDFGSSTRVSFTAERGGETVTRTLEPFTSISFTEPDEKVYYIITDSAPGAVSIEVDETVSKPTITMNKKLAEHIVTKTDTDGTLVISSDFSSLVNSKGASISVTVNAPDRIVLKVPAHMLKQISATDEPKLFPLIALSDYSADSLCVNPGSSFEFDNCRINKLNVTTLLTRGLYSIPGLSFHSGSDVNTMELINCNDIRLETDDDSAIENLRVHGFGESSTANVTMYVANIKHLEWLPTSSQQDIKISRSAPFTVNF